MMWVIIYVQSEVVITRFEVDILADYKFTSLSTKLESKRKWACKVSKLLSPKQCVSLYTKLGIASALINSYWGFKVSAMLSEHCVKQKYYKCNKSWNYALEQSAMGSLTLSG